MRGADRGADPRTPVSGGLALAELLAEAGLPDGLLEVHDIVTRSVELGAKVAAGGSYTSLFYRPTVLADVPLNSPAYTEEIFGPIVPVIGYDTVDEAIDLINASEYGLSVAIERYLF